MVKCGDSASDSDSNWYETEKLNDQQSPNVDAPTATPHPDNPSPIFNLIDDCLTEIFHWLPLFDLISISDTCVRFRTIASTVFASTHKVFDSSLFNDRHCNMYQCSRLLQNFGHLIAHLKINQKNHLRNCAFSDSYPNKIIKFFNGTFKSLHLMHFVIDECYAAMLRPHLRRLRSLTLSACRLDGPISIDLFSNCNELVNLNVGDARDFGRCVFGNYFPKLETLTVQGVEFKHMDALQVGEFFKKHRNLKDLKLGNATMLEPETSMTFLRHICTNFSGSLRSLDLANFYLDETLVTIMQPFLKCLEFLKLFPCHLSDAFDTDQFYSSCNQLVDLEISDEFITTKHHFSRLEYLKLHKRSICKDMSNVIAFLQNHQNIREIKFYDFAKISHSALSKNFNQLEKISINTVDDFNDITQFTQLKHIRKLTLFGNSRNKKDTYGVSTFIKNCASMTSMELLRLWYVRTDNELLKDIAKYRNLRRLEVMAHNKGDVLVPLLLRLEPLGSLSQLYEIKLGGFFQIIGNDLVELVIKLTKLRFLSIDLLLYPLDAKIYDKIHQIVRNSNRVLTLFSNVWYSDDGCGDDIHSVQIEFIRNV